MKDKIFNVVIPSEKKIKIKNGHKREVREQVFRLCVVEMIATDDAWSVVRNTPQVTGFVGTANQVVPSSRMRLIKFSNGRKGDTVRHAIDLCADDAVIIIDGPFRDLKERWARLTEERGKVKVLVPMFGRDASRAGSRPGAEV